MGTFCDLKGGEGQHMTARSQNVGLKGNISPGQSQITFFWELREVSPAGFLLDTGFILRSRRSRKTTLLSCMWCGVLMYVVKMMDG